jgi:hypothetical protein
MRTTIRSESDPTNDQNVDVRLARLAAFAPLFRDPTTVFGIRHPDTGTGTRDDPWKFGWYQLSEVGTKFVEMLYGAGWVMRNFDWPNWAWSEEAQRLCSDRATLVTTNCDQLAKLLTALVRQDRFCDGVLEEAFEDGLLRAIAERAETLTVEER